MIEYFHLSWYKNKEIFHMKSYTYLPWNGICVKKMGKELGHIPEFIGFQSMNCVILFSKHVLERLNVFLVNHAKSLQKISNMYKNLANIMQILLAGLQ